MSVKLASAQFCRGLHTWPVEERNFHLSCATIGRGCTIAGLMASVIELRVNGTTHRIQADPQSSLLSVLREELDLTGAKFGCGAGDCGACTVLLDGVARRSCITPVNAVVGKEITTIEGLEREGRLHPLQEAFLQAGALQCGYCTSGMIMSGVALLKKNSK